MQAARLHAPGRMLVEDVPRPVPGPHDLLVRVEACGICGSDRHMFRGEYPTARPVTLGHEFSGIVEEAGAAVTSVRVGMRISGDPNIACGRCAFCRGGRPNLCAELSPIGVMRDGGFAEYVLVPEGQAAVLPGDLDPRHGAFCEPVSCCLHAIDTARIPRGGSVLILGGGVIGLLMAELALQAGAGTVVLATRQAPRRALAQALGAIAVDATGGDEAVLDLLPGGADVVLECAGVPATFLQSLRLARRGGTVVFFGVVPQDERVEVSPFELLTRELRLEAAWLNPLTHPRAAALIAGRALSLDRLITRTIELGEVPDVVGAAPALGEIKVVMVR
ncbi:MAG: zinc-dependent alcohol dehydrogenase family protein [Devosia sp.]|mgnify:CR=1 FL=1|uniref:zinc-dependent alcohol dehydrogenase family protein n=1 Tax=Devosia sp. TaxID=1871048 RepID=UPI001AC735BB|nr:zinc-dependent alcohol dehydrogenase family protein [Devosia sp.]MBN9316968.1 zinc-dependent alcohol dehydrogenase family protein [Devosia sp.]